MRVFPSLIAVKNPLNLEKEIIDITPFCDGFHVDVMDNNFVPNLTFGPAMVNAIAAFTQKKVWVHLMVRDPESIIHRMVLPSDSIVTFHYENEVDKEQIIQIIKDKNWRPSIAINPDTPIRDIFSYIEMVDHLVIMSVNPGFSGQQFLNMAVEKVAEVHHHVSKITKKLDIAVDGGLNKVNIDTLRAEVAIDFAVGSYLFQGQSPHDILSKLKED